VNSVIIVDVVHMEGTMKVLVTGASGFVGSHSVKALIDAGHQVRVLARSRSRLDAALAPHGPLDVDVADGDVTDRDAVERAMVGIDGVLHAANVFTFDPRQTAIMEATNAAGTDVVLSAARANACDPIVHVSSVVALLPRRGPVLDPDGPVGAPAGAYSKSKARAEEVARRHQAECDAITITYPGAVFGPHDPGPGEMVHTLRGFLGNQLCFRLSNAALLQVDVRWLARLHAALFVPKQGPRRITAGGTWIDWRDYFGLLRRLTGRSLPMLFPTPKPIALATGLFADVLQRLVPTRLPVAYETTWFTFHVAPTDDSRAIALVGPPPPLEETVADAIRWCVEAGHLPAPHAGTLLRQLASESGAAPAPFTNKIA
jgi:dihydroflavonol-4-reductase